MEKSRKVYGWLVRDRNAAVGCSPMWADTMGEECYCGNLLWQSSLTLLFPDQVRRAVVSVPSNIAEGCGRASNRDYAHFLSIARGSLYETMTQLEMAKELGYLETIDEVETLAAEISRMLTTLMKKYTPLSNS